MEETMSESNMRKNLCRKLAKLDAQAVENRVGPGTPDVEYIGGHIECKWLRAWPKRPSTVVKLDHPLLKSQKVWIRRRIRRGGTAFVMLQCRHEWLLFRGFLACDWLGKLTRSELAYRAYRYWERGLDADELIAILETMRPDRVWTDGEKREARWKADGGSW